MKHLLICITTLLLLSCGKQYEKVTGIDVAFGGYLDSVSYIKADSQLITFDTVFMELIDSIIILDTNKYKYYRIQLIGTGIDITTVQRYSIIDSTYKELRK